MDTATIQALLAGGGTIFLALVGWGLKIGGSHWSFLKNEQARRMIYDVIKGQVRTTMPAVVLGPNKGGITKAQARKRVVTASLGILGPLAKEFIKMNSETQEAIVSAAVHSVKKEMLTNEKVTS